MPAQGELRFQASGREGYEAVISPGAGLKYIHEFGVLCLGAPGVYAGATGACEATLHLIEGACQVATRGGEFSASAERAAPFSSRPAAFYLPPATDYIVTALGPRMEMAIALAHAQPSAQAGPAAIGPAATAIRPEALVPRQIGQGNWQRVVTIIVPPEFAAHRLILGETLNPPGNWSGVPAHKHDTFRPEQESVHEELYYFRTDPSDGWGIERIYDASGREELILLQDRVVTIMPRGYHTVVAAPGSNLYYAFVLGGPDRQLVPHVDPLQARLVA